MQKISMDNETKKPRHGSVVATHPFHCITPVQLRFSDIDMLGHLNNSRYFELFDVAKNDYFTRVAGGDLKWQRPPVMIVNINCDFLSQTTFNERVEVQTQVDRLGDKSFVLIQQLVNSDTGEVKCCCAATMVNFDVKALVPASISPEWRQAIARFEHRDDLA